MTDYRESAWALLIADCSSLEDVGQALAKRSDEELVEECLRAWSDADKLDRELLIRAFGELRDVVEGELRFGETLMPRGRSRFPAHCSPRPGFSRVDSPAKPPP